MREGKGTDHHLDFLHSRTLFDHEPSFLDARLAIPQSPRLTVRDGTVRTSVLSDVGFWCTICQFLGRNRLSRSMNADRDFRLFVIRQSVVEDVNQLLNGVFVTAHLRVRQSWQTSISCVKPGCASPTVSRSMATTGPVSYNL